MTVALQSQKRGLTTEDSLRLDELLAAVERAAGMFGIILNGMLYALKEEGRLQKGEFLYSDAPSITIGDRTLKVELSFKLKVTLKENEDVLGVVFATNIQNILKQTSLDQLEILAPECVEKLIEAGANKDPILEYIQGLSITPATPSDNSDGSASSSAPQLSSQKAATDDLPTGQYI